jgi:hypothetical protein
MFEILKYIPTLTEDHSEFRDKSRLDLMSRCNLFKADALTQVDISLLFQCCFLYPAIPHLHHPRFDTLRFLHYPAQSLDLS